MRVISGSARGLKLASPKGIDTRPTLDRVKEAVFSILLPYINDSNVLDLFSGSGALAIEALSRGAKRAVLVDNSQSAVDCIKANVEAAKFSDKTSVVKSDYIRYIKSCNENFDLIFLDPPYSKNYYKSALNLIFGNKLLANGGVIVAEWDFLLGFTDEISEFEILKEKKYGRVGITILK